jgi:tetratricopeptide (TPR) repeat protein
MVKSLRFFPEQEKKEPQTALLPVLVLVRYLWLASLTILFASSCQRKEEIWYQKTFSPEERKELSLTLLDGIRYHYQGSPACQMILQESLSYDPDNAKTHREIGVPYLKRGVASAFPHYYGKAAELDPLGWTGWRGYLYLYFYRDYERALADFNLTDTLTPNQVDYPQSISVDYMRGICYLMLDDYPNAIDYFDRHIAYETSITGFEYIDPKTLLYRGIAYLGLNQPDTAIHSFRSGLTIDDENADLYYWLAQVQGQQGQLAKARQNLERAHIEFAKKNYNRRYYVEEFFQTYETDLDALATQLNARE